MTKETGARVARNQPWANPVIGGFLMVAANFLFADSVHRLLDGRTILVITACGSLLLILGACVAAVSATSRAKAVCYLAVAVGLAMALVSVIHSPT
jgi:hypothetical protein